MDLLKERFNEKANALKHKLKAALKEHGELKADEVTLNQIFGGARGIAMMVWEPSVLDPNEGIRFRGFSIPELQDKIPAIGNATEPLPEGLFWLMLTGDIPNPEQIMWLTEDWKRRGSIPDHVFRTIDALPAETHPMTQYSIGITALQTQSVFARRYDEGMSKNEYWEATYEDAMNLIAKMPRLAAYIYRRSFFHGAHIEPDYTLDWAANFAHMLGFDGADFKDFMRLYLTIHADHEGGNASAHTTYLVNSTLSDAYYSFAAGINALAGPLHGLANQEVIKWIQDMLEELNTNNPSKEEIAGYVHKTLQEGKVVPGYGHAVLRQPDPRFMAQKRFAEKHLQDSDMVQVVWKVFQVVPEILLGLGKVKNPWPNVDAHSGAILVHYGLTQPTFYTVLFGVSRALGVMAAMCWNRALGVPLERPKSVNSDWIFSFIENQLHLQK